MSTKKSTETIDLNRFSYFSAPITNNQPKCEISLDMVHSVITSNHFNEATKQLRLSNDKSEQAELKKTKLDYVTFSGVFKKRANDSLTNHSGLICLDIDDLKSVKRTKEKIIDTQPPSLLFTSPRGNGLKVVYKIETNEGDHIDYFKSLKELFSIELDIQIDDSCKDVSRACFLCHDPEAYLNKNAEVLDKSIIDTFYPIEHNQSNTILDSNKIDRVVNWINKKQSFYEGNRNNFIKHLSAAFNRIGLPKYEAENYLLKYAEPGFDEKEITSIVDSIYKNTNWHNISRLSKKVKAAPTPLLPIEGFPQYLQDFINEYVEVFKVPRDYIASSVIFSTALAIGDKIELNDKYDNIPLLWLAIVGNVSSGKTEPLKTCLSYFQNKDKLAFREYEAQLCEFEVEKEKPKKERNESLQAPRYFQYTVNDYTPESMYDIHSINNRGLCIYRDEIKGWLDDFGRYNKSGEQSTILSTFYRNAMQVNRASKKPVYIDKPCIFISGGIQPGVLSDLAKDNRAENGFLSRFLFAFPDLVKRQPYSKAKLNLDTYKGYQDYLHSLASLNETINITLSDEAETIYSDWYDKNSNKINNESSAYLQGVYGKLDVYALRLAIVVYGMNLTCYQRETSIIDAKTMQTAIEITEYFRITAVKVYSKIFNDDKSMDKKDVINFMSSLGKSQSEIARVLGLSQPYVNKILKNQSK